MTIADATTSNPGGRVQRVLFQPSNDIASQDLYIKVRRGRLLSISRTSLTVARYSTVSTRTYFGRFPAAYYQRWTEVRSVRVRATVNGRGRIRVFASDDIDRERSVGGMDIDSAEPTDISIPVAIDRFLDGGFVWVDIESGDASLTISDLRFEAGDVVTPKGLNIVICTFNRATDCLTTLLTLCGDDEATEAIERVIVVDQGTDLVCELDGFAAVEESLGERLSYIRQPNLGGAGGFTRGMYEILADVDLPESDIVLMDDDIVLETESIVRMAAFSSRTIDPVIVGAQMLYLYHPNMLHTSAEHADLDRLRAGIPVHAREQGMNLTKKLPFRWAEGGYNAWWTCLIPSNVVKRIGYPMPVFFQWDDIEYGLRARGRQIPTVTLPGSAVWHADFALKDRDDWSRYFSYRNSMIVAAVHGNWKTRHVVQVLFSDLFEMIMSLHYGLAATTILAIEGFLDGPDAIRAGSAEAVAQVRAERAKYADTIKHKPEEMVETGLFALPAIHSGGHPRLPRVIKIYRSVWQVLGLNTLVGKISSSDSNWWHSSQFRQAIVTDAALDSFRIRRFDAKTALRLVRASASTLWRLWTRGGRTVEKWRRAHPSLTDRSTWDAIFSPGGTDDHERKSA